MPAFEYEALDPAGKRTKGLLSADSELAARRELRRRRMAPLKLHRAGEKPATAGVALPRLFAPAGLKPADLMSVTRQLSTLIGAGMPVEEAVGLIANQAEKTPVRRILMTVRGRVTEGERLSDAMAEHASSFPPVYRAMVAAGEGSGGLSQVLDRLADYLEKSEALKRRIGVAMIYPSVLGVLALVVVGVLMVFIVPRIAEQFTSLDVTLPLITRAMIALSEFLQAGWLWIALALFALVLAASVLSQRPGVKRAVDGLVLSLPWLGNFVRRIESARFARTMSILIASGAVLPDALRAARRASANAHFQDRIARVIEAVEQGSGLSDALRSTQWFPPLMVYMIASGERSGRLDDMFARAAEHLEAEVDGAVSVGLSLLEPGIIIVMGGLVAVIVLSILLPILRLNTLAMGG
ncbi:type II secretion system protein GspF [Marinicauda algicola]|uniref:General secretion pathway protein F n=1 Tax=Marinicauda algicola TaxID=2029849 RepID=A0A4V3RYH0_9PROT|nr:type II secretion system inner membrane protein GspF [Marinicauda algicola]TGY90389.1 type II secretion system protein GspF [Marinicauda algicola]